VAHRHDEIINGEQTNTDGVARVRQQGEAFASFDAQWLDTVQLKHLGRRARHSVLNKSSLADVGHGDVGLERKASNGSLAGCIGIEALIEKHPNLLKHL